MAKLGTQRLFADGKCLATSASAWQYITQVILTVACVLHLAICFSLVQLVSFFLVSLQSGWAKPCHANGVRWQFLLSSLSKIQLAMLKNQCCANQVKTFGKKVGIVSQQEAWICWIGEYYCILFAWASRKPQKMSPCFLHISKSFMIFKGICMF